MFGNSPSSSSADSARRSSADANGTIPQPTNASDESSQKRNSIAAGSPARKSSQDEVSPTGEKKRRSSGVSKASALFSSAKNSLHLPGSSSHSPPSEESGHTTMTPMQRLGKTDPALSVPQGSLNNSAGESRPGPRSTFRVGVTEDKNKKCRRTMEDTHAYLYNFLTTPAPSLATDTGSSKTHSSGGSPGTGSASSLVDPSNVVETDNGYFAIFDGHAGTFAADWCGKKLHVLLEDIIRRNPNTPIPELLDQTFTNVDQQLEKLPLKNSGCTAVIAVLRWEDRIPNSQSATGSTSIAPAAAAAAKAALDVPSSASGTQASESIESQGDGALEQAKSELQQSATRQRVLYTANVGDARIILCRNGKALRLSYDHKGSDENEGKRIASAGGLILNNRVNGVLAVTRALGDAYIKDLVTGHPYTTETVIQPDVDEFLILACDGLWDVCSDQEAVDLIRETQDPQIASKQLVDYALGRFSTDNLSCMVVRFDNKALQSTLEKKEGPIGVEGDPTSTKGNGVSEADAIVAEAQKHIEGENADQAKVANDIIEEEEEQEPGPELTPPGPSR